MIGLCLVVIASLQLSCTVGLPAILVRFLVCAVGPGLSPLPFFGIVVPRPRHVPLSVVPVVASGVVPIFPVVLVVPGVFPLFPGVVLVVPMVPGVAMVRGGGLLRRLVVLVVRWDFSVLGRGCVGWGCCVIGTGLEAIINDIS
jgi:hypothetical protein